MRQLMQSRDFGDTLWTRFLADSFIAFFRSLIRYNIFPSRIKSEALPSVFFIKQLNASTSQLIRRKQVDFFHPLSFISSSFCRVNSFITDERSSRAAPLCDSGFPRGRETFVAKYIMRLSASSFNVRQLMELHGYARCQFPRFSVSAVIVTLSYFRRPHRNSKVVGSISRVHRIRLSNADSNYSRGEAPITYFSLEVSEFTLDEERDERAQLHDAKQSSTNRRNSQKGYLKFHKIEPLDLNKHSNENGIIW